jgi:hypothetical protein
VAVIDQGWALPPGNAWPGTRLIELARVRLLPMAKVGYLVFTRRCRTPRPRGWSPSITTHTNGRLAPIPVVQMAVGLTNQIDSYRRSRPRQRDRRVGSEPDEASNPDASRAC